MLLRVLSRSSLVAGIALSLLACGGGGGGDDGPLGGSLRVSGDVVDLQTEEAVTGGASVTTSGVAPTPQVTTQGARFVIEGVPENSAFHILASVPPTHRATYSPAVTVTTDDVEGVKAFAVSESFLADMAAAFGVDPSAGKGILLARIVDASGRPRAGVAGTALDVDGIADGPYFLDDAMAANPALTATSASGWAVFFELDPGVAGMSAATGSDLTLDMPVSPVASGAVTVVTVRATDGETTLPTNVSFSRQVFPIFSRRGCEACHSGNGIGRDLGGLTLDGSTNLVYRELREESLARVVVASPATSLVLTMPSREDPPDLHPTVVFPSSSDPDYQLLLAWITEGALDN